MKNSNASKQCFMKSIATCLLLLISFFSAVLQAQTSSWIVTSGMPVVDGSSIPFSNVQGGDTVFLQAGKRDKLLIRNFAGTPGHPITFINLEGIVEINTNSYYGITISNCRYTRFTGQYSDSNFYGIQVTKVAAGAGIGINNRSSDIEIDHVSIENCSTEGIMAKTDPDCSFTATRDNFTQFNTHIHDNYIADVGNEGMYIGSSYYSGVTLHCNGKDTLVKPPVLDHVNIYNNIVKRTGWDGIQVSSAPLHCQVHHNTITNDSQAEEPNQMSGILLGGGSACSCYNNLVTDGKGDGIEDHGLGGDSIYNNIIVNAGKTYFPNDATKMKHGIFVSDVSTIPGAAFHIFYNDIINPKSDGIRFQSTRSKQNLVASNLLVNPGNYQLYQNDNTSFSGNDAYIMIPNRATDIRLANNFFAPGIGSAGISANGYAPLAGSPLINKGLPSLVSVITDFNGHLRPKGGLPDIGAIEYDGGDDRLFDDSNNKALLLFPNPTHSILYLRYRPIDITVTNIRIYTAGGRPVMQVKEQPLVAAEQVISINVDSLSSGVYLYSIETARQTTQGKFIKL